jgi:hypothetical protein
VAIEREEPAVEEKPAPPPPPRKAVAQQLPRVPKKPALPQLSEEDGTGVKLVLGAGPSETRWSVNGEDLPCNCGCVYMVPMGQKIVLEAHAPGYVPFRREFTARQRVVLAINLKEEKSAKAPAEK